MILLVIGTLLSEVAANLGRAVIAARSRRNEAEASRCDLEITLHRLADAQMRLVELSRQAGMAEVATGVLHNVGNVLTSLSVSTQMQRETLDRSKLAALGEVAQLLATHADDLPHFLGHDPKGRLVVPLLAQLSLRLENERLSILSENDALGARVEHIKRIIGRQQSYARTVAVLEPCSVRQLVDEATALIAGQFASNHIRIVRNLGFTPDLLVDRHQTMQILINLLSNAKNAVDAAGGSGGEVSIESGLDPEGYIFIRVVDNGVGIAPENLGRIFEHGFTTRPDGHGFGLHSAANAAIAMGGRLSSTSDGPNRGATFTLTLPARPPVAEAA